MKAFKLFYELTLLIMKYAALFFLLSINSCSENNTQQNKKDMSAVINISNDTIPAVRKQVNKTPVASYIIPINNPLLHQYFGVKVYETVFTFQYLLRMQFEGMIETDTLKIPNFGIWPTVKVNEGPVKFSCIIGFLDKEKHFREYKMLAAKNDKLRLTVLKRYAVGIYSKQE